MLVYNTISPFCGYVRNLILLTEHHAVFLHHKSQQPDNFISLDSFRNAESITSKGILHVKTVSLALKYYDFNDHY